MSEFAGCPEEMYQFFWEIAFQNNREFFEANRERYRRVVQQPMLALAGELAPAALSIDPRFNVRPSSVVSRIRRDTRFTRDKSPYRDHVWLGYKPAGARTSECFVLYAEFERERYGYGMGMYAPEPALMAELRARMLARPQRFLALVQAPRAEGEPERIPTNVNDLLDELLEQSVRIVGKPVAMMNKEDKVKAIGYLNDAGAMLITKSGDKIAKYFGISKYTLYSYLDTSNTSTQQS